MACELLIVTIADCLLGKEVRQLPHTGATAGDLLEALTGETLRAAEARTREAGSIGAAKAGASLRVGKPHRIEGDPPVADVGLDENPTGAPERFGGFTDPHHARGRAIDHAFVVAAGAPR